MHCRAIWLVVSLSALLAGLRRPYLCALQCTLLYTIYFIHQGGWELQLTVGYSSGSS